MTSQITCSTPWEWVMLFGCSKWVKMHMGLVERKPDFGGCEQQKRKPACASAQSDQRLCYSLIIKYHIKACYEQNFKFLASYCTWEDWFETRFVGNPKDRFCHVVAHIVVLFCCYSRKKSTKLHRSRVSDFVQFVLFNVFRETNTHTHKKMFHNGLAQLYSDIEKI